MFVEKECSYVHLYDMAPAIIWNHSIVSVHSFGFCSMLFPPSSILGTRNGTFHTHSEVENGFFLICNFNAYVNVFTSSTDIHYDFVPFLYLFHFHSFFIFYSLSFFFFAISGTHSYHSVTHDWSIIFSMWRQKKGKEWRRKRMQKTEKAFTLNIPIIPPKW